MARASRKKESSLKGVRRRVRKVPFLSRRRSGFIAVSLFFPSPYLSPSPLLVSLSANASSDFLLSRHDTVGEFRGQFFVPSPSRGGGPGGGGTVRRGSDLAIDYLIVQS